MAGAPSLLLVGSGSELRSGHLLRDVSHNANIVLLQPGPATWQREFVDRVVEIDPADPAAVLTQARGLAAEHTIGAVASYDELLVSLASKIAAELGLRGVPADAAAVVRDKHAQRLRLGEGPPYPPRSALVHDTAAGVRAAAELGYPVVIKPRSLSGSLGVRIAQGPDEFPALLDSATSVDPHGMGPVHGMLVEEFLDGTEYSVDCWVLDGEARVLFFAEILKGYSPSAINVGCIVGRGTATPEVEAAIAEAACAAAVKCGLSHTVANVDIRWSADQARVLEVNGRPAGELLPYLAFLCSGVRVGAALADVAFGRRPPAPSEPDRAAGVAFIAPPHAMRFGSVRIAEEWARNAGVLELITAASPGDEVIPPPDDPWGRVGWAVVTGATAKEVRRRLDLVWSRVEIAELVTDERQPADARRRSIG